MPPIQTKKSVLFSDNEPFVCEWVGNLYPQSVVLKKDIKELKKSDVSGFQRVHLFCGIGGWQLALDLAGWVGPVWTGSCPCQPFSAAGKRQGEADERHLWPEMFRLIRECRPPVVFGEQVASGDGLRWLDRVFADLEGAGYACGAADLCSAGVGSPNIRQRLFWVANARSSPARRDTGRSGPATSDQSGEVERQRQAATEPERRGEADRLAVGDGQFGGQGSADGGGSDQGSNAEPRAGLGGSGEPERLGSPSRSRPQERIGNEGIQREAGQRNEGQATELRGDVSGVGQSDSDEPRGERFAERWTGEAAGSGPWSDYRIIPCLDGKSRRVGCGVKPLAHGIPAKLGPLVAEIRRLGVSPRRVASLARRNRTGRLMGYGNSICPQVASVFIRCVMESLRG